MGDKMKLRLFAVDIIDGSETKLSFDTIIKTEDLDKWRKLIGDYIMVDVTGENT